MCRIPGYDPSSLIIYGKKLTHYLWLSAFTFSECMEEILECLLSFLTDVKFYEIEITKLL